MDANGKRLQKRLQVLAIVRAGLAIHERKTMTRTQRGKECTEAYNDVITKADVTKLPTDLKCDVPDDKQWDLVVKKSLQLTGGQANDIVRIFLILFEVYCKLCLSKSNLIYCT
jgi:hypothetical protein